MLVGILVVCVGSFFCVIVVCIYVLALFSLNVCMKLPKLVSFVGLFSWLAVLSNDIAIRHGLRHGFQLDWFIILGVVGNAGVNGLSVSGIMMAYCSSTNGVSLRKLRLKCEVLTKYGYLSRVRRGRFYYYVLSSHAEKLLIKAVGREELREMNAQFRLWLKDIDK